MTRISPAMLRAFSEPIWSELPLLINRHQLNRGQEYLLYPIAEESGGAVHVGQMPIGDIERHRPCPHQDHHRLDVSVRAYWLVGKTRIRFSISSRRIRMPSRPRSTLIRMRRKSRVRLGRRPHWKYPDPFRLTQMPHSNFREGARRPCRPQSCSGYIFGPAQRALTFS